MSTNYYTKEELIFTKIKNLPIIEGAEEDEDRPWLPVTYIDSKNKRVTARALYPMGDGDGASQACPYCDGTGGLMEQNCTTCGGSGKIRVLCEACHGTGHVDGNCDLPLCQVCGGTRMVDAKCTTCGGSGTMVVPADEGHECQHCHGTGKIGGNGAITVTPDGVVTLNYDDGCLGVDDKGKIFVRLTPKYHGGLDVDKVGRHDELYVKVDEKSIRINEDGFLEIVDFVKPYAHKVTKTYTFASAHDTTVPLLIDTFSIDDDAVEKVHVHLTIGISNVEYASASSLTRMQLQIGNETSPTISWDQTLPYTLLNFDAIVDVSVSHTVSWFVLLPYASDADPDSIPANTVMTWTANVTSC